MGVHKMNYEWILLLVKVLTIVIAFLILTLAFVLIKYTKNKEKEKFYKRLLGYSKDCLYYYQIYPETKFIYLSPSFKEMFGISEQSFYDDCELMFELVHPDDFEEFHVKTIGQADFNNKFVARFRNSSGAYIWTEDSPTPIYDEAGRLIGIEGSHRDITERVKLEKELEYRSNHDKMTGTYNRDYFEEYSDKLNNKIDSKVGIIICDLNGLKSLNDNLGHKYGDVMIKESGKLLNKYSAENIIVSRIGGDEFSIILTGVDETYVLNMIKNINEDIVKFNEGSEEIKINIAFGFAVCQNSLNNMNLVFTEADKRMYQEKKDMKNSLLL
jgi:diguanylate cyclase (GGDEF)-like protein/PAS domain S-box-containing protein